MSHRCMAREALGTTSEYRKRLIMAETSESEFVNRWLETALGRRPKSSVIKAILDSTEAQVLDTQLLLEKLMSLSVPQGKEQKSVSG